MYLSCKYEKQAVFTLSDENEFRFEDQSTFNIWRHTLICPEKADIPDEGSLLRGPFHDDDASNLTKKAKHDPEHVSKSSNVESFFTPNSKSYNSLEEFLLNYVRQNSPNATLRSKKEIGNGKFLSYAFNNYRFCELSNRNHKSNNVLVIVNLDDQTYYQKCMDPVCRNFGQAPKHVLPDGIVFQGELLENLLDDAFWED
ncbi:hypothetical protein O9G_000127 [Rozella allomycis CSF55]|uniref:DNA-directed primase/polymerase protein n=1 Tax=Rozella allomycis (strain CSF55) TaxID=988480 RepID=A0A075AT26_ROZAC|nr:hypothetical protein O9G_000127 [Rozella allomycis CSF55]|eukprot:EPZ31648.1 hypothetical protein O9G_000127 [Rozella allomycis CSF55]